MVGVDLLDLVREEERLYLEFTDRILEEMERQGLDLDDLDLPGVRVPGTLPRFEDLINGEPGGEKLNLCDLVHILYAMGVRAELRLKPRSRTSGGGEE